MKNIKLTVQYDGTNYCGWQKQEKVKTIQGELEEAIFKLTGVYPELNGCSRTDSGVHAIAHISNFFTESPIPAEKFFRALNAFLPGDIRVKDSIEESEEFHSRFSCIGKKYVYRIYCCTTKSALLTSRAGYEPKQLDIAAMKQAAEFFVGEFDFKAFCSVGGTALTSVRRILDTQVYERESVYGGTEIFFEVAGTGFLYNMVRIMTGTLISVGKGQKKPEDVRSIILSGDRRNAGVTVPPQGLYLKEVYYGTI